MKKVNVLAVSVAACLIASASLGASAQNGGATKNEVRLKVTFEPTMSDGTPCAVLGDGLGEYVDGADGVTAYFSSIGHLQSYFGGRSSPRGVVVTYSEFYPTPDHPSPGVPPISGMLVYGELITVNALASYTNLQDMRVGDEPQCLKTGWTLGQDSNIWEKGSTIWENNYHRNGSHFFDPLTSYVIATCVEEASGICTKWELEPAASACNSGTIPTLVNVVKKMILRPNKITYQDYGLWKLPFRLTITRIQ